MKKILRNWFINGVALALTDWFFPGIEISYLISDFLVASFLFTILLKLIRPVYDLAFLPLHLITLGMFRWVNVIISLGLAIYLANGLELKSFYFSGVSLGGMSIPASDIVPILSLFIGAILLNFIKKAIRWVLRRR